MTLENVGDVEKRLSTGRPSVRELYAIWELRRPATVASDSKAVASEGRQIDWLRSLAAARSFVERSLDHGECLLTCDAAREILQSWRDGKNDRDENVVRIGMAYARALTRLGFTEKARRELTSYGDSESLDGELRSDVLLLLGDVLREESHYASSRNDRQDAANLALRYYERALEITPDRPLALGLTAAMALILGAPELRAQAESRARRILEVTAAAGDSNARILWVRAVAQTVLGDLDAARAGYRKMGADPEFTTADLAEARYRAQFHAEAVGKPRNFFQDVFPPLQLVVFAGDRLGGTDGAGPIPTELIDAMRASIRAELDRFDVRCGLVCPAAGADLLFIEALLERKGDVHVVMPWSREVFLESDVRRREPAGGPAIWEPLFKRAMREAATIREIGQSYKPASDVAWEYLLEVTAGVALNTARASRLDAVPMTLRFDGDAGRSNFAGSFLDFWQRQLLQEPILITLPAGIAPPAGSSPKPPRRRCENPTMRQEVKSILFADVEGYSKLPEEAVPAFVDVFMGKLSKLIAGSRHAPRSVATWGDALHAVFDYTHQAGGFALEIVQMIEAGKDDWLRSGLYWQRPTPDGNAEKHTLQIRIGLHAGPVFVHFSPVVRQIGFTGAHVSRAARIEPVAGTGEVFVSEEFAALAELADEVRRRDKVGINDGGAGFVCEYAGTRRLAKNYPGRHRIYRLVPQRDAAIEELAKAAHRDYCKQAVARGESLQTNAMMLPWDKLPLDIQDANRAQVLDIPNKLEFLGYEIARFGGLNPSEISISDGQLEELAVREHDRWMNERRSQGWTYAPVRDNSRKLHPMLVPWDDLTDTEKQKDRDAVLNMSMLLALADLKLRKIATSA
jgi:class 3 adenylate cyclase